MHLRVRLLERLLVKSIAVGLAPLPGLYERHTLLFYLRPAGHIDEFR
jgi:hypothetical protein